MNSLNLIKKNEAHKMFADIFSAFTMAEVLITLGVIGIVAAMTLPALINKIHLTQYIHS